MTNTDILKELEKYVWFQHKIEANITLDIIASFLRYHKRISAYDVLYILEIHFVSDDIKTVDNDNKLPRDIGWTSLDKVRIVRDYPDIYRIIFPEPESIESTEGINWPFDF